MRILCLSDLHADRAAAVRLAGMAASARADMIVSGGDLGSDGEHLPSLYSALRAPGIPVLCVPGNHDGRTGFATSIYAAGFTDLHGVLLECNGLWFAGRGVHTDADLPSSDPARQDGDPLLASVLRAARDVPADRLVLVSHVPPHGTACAVDSRGRDHGSMQLRRWVEELQPVAVLCGHVHHRDVVIDRIGRSEIVNAGPHGHLLVLP